MFKTFIHSLKVITLTTCLTLFSLVAAGEEPTNPSAMPVELIGYRTSEGVVCNTALTLRLAIEDLMATFGDHYPRGREFLERLEKMGGANAPPAELASLSAEALLANPLMDFDKGNYTVSFDAVKRSGYSPTASPLAVTMDGKPLLTLDASRLSEAWGSYTSPVFAVTSGAHTLAFTVGAGEGMDLIDNVEVKTDVHKGEEPEQPQP